MNGIFFILPFLLIASVGLVNDSYAYRGLDYSLTDNPDGSFTKTIGLSPYIYDGNSYVPFIANGNEIQTNHGSVSLVDDIFTFYPNGIINQPIYEDGIITGYFRNDAKFDDSVLGKYADVTNQNIWTYPNNLNNAIPTTSWNGNELVTSKLYPGVGLLEYKYIQNNGVWKTQLEITNLSGLTTKVFGFDQIININSDTIKFGGVVRNLDNFDGQTFNKQFLDNNKGKVLDLMTGEYFDFDIAYDDLYSITVHDTGVGKSQLVFDFRTSNILLPNEKLILDPTVTPGYSGHIELFDDSGTASTTCDNVTFSKDTVGVGDLGVFLRNDASASNHNCHVAIFSFDRTALPENIEVTALDFNYEVDGGSSPQNCDFNPMTVNVTSATNQQLWTDANDGTPYVSNDATCKTIGTGYSEALGTAGYTDFEDAVDLFNIAVTYNSMTRPATSSSMYMTAVTLSITYTEIKLPTQPTGLTVIPISTSQLDVDWDDAPTPDNLTGWRIFEESPVGNGWIKLVNDTGTTTSHYNHTSLSTKTQYNYMVAGINATGVGNNSTASAGYTWGVPDPITGFTIINPTVSTLDPNYTASVKYGYEVTGYETLRDNVFLIYQGNVTTFTDGSLSTATSYEYSIRALSSFGNSTWVNATGITVSGAPTGLTVNDCYHTCTTQLNVEWVAPVPATGINGYRIFMETPIGNGFTTEVANTTTTTLYYNDTGLTAGQFYNYKVAATTGGGISANSSAYAQSPHKLPDSVDDLILTTNEFLQFLAVWTQPNLYGTLTGYQINYTTPAGDPQTIYTSTNPGVTATISGLDPTVVHSIRVAANTYHGINATFGNIENGTLSSEIAVGDLTFAPGTNTDVEPIWFENYIVDSSTNDVQVRFSSSLTVDCSITERIANNITNYTSISETAAVGYVYHNFTVTNAGNDILDWNCYDQTDSTIDGQYSLAQSEAASGVGGVANIPLFSLMGNFTGGLYGTEGNFAGIDLITLFIVIVSMLGFNRKNPALGVGVMATMLGAAWWYGLIPWTSGVLGGIAVVLVLAIGQGTKRD